VDHGKAQNAPWQAQVTDLQPHAVSPQNRRFKGFSTWLVVKDIAANVSNPAVEKNAPL